MAITRKIMGTLISQGIKGVGPLDSAREVAQAALDAEGGDQDKAVSRLVRKHMQLAAGQGFITGLGGIIVLPVSLPANVVGFYTLAARLAASIATVRGYDVDEPAVRAGIEMSMMGDGGRSVITGAGLTPTGWAQKLALGNLPPSVMTLLNKGIGFRAAARTSASMLGRLGKAVPLAGGVVGAGLDTWMMRTVAGHARKQFVDKDEVEFAESDD